MRISHLFEYVLLLGGLNLEHNFLNYAFSWEVGNYLFLSDGNDISLCIYSFCNLDDAERIISLPYDEATKEYYIVLARRQVRGEVVIPDLVCGKISSRAKNIAIEKWKSLGVKKILYHKSKLNKFYLTELYDDNKRKEVNENGCSRNSICISSGRSW